MPVAPELSYFIIASCILILAPGPDIIFLITQSIHKGSRAGMFTAIGLACGNLIHTLIAVIGISAVIMNSPIAFSSIKIIGAIYLLYLAYEALKSNTRSDKDESENTYEGSLLLRGLYMNILNPKVSIFFIAFFPQFITEENNNISQQLLFLGITFTCLVLLIFGSIGFFAGKAHSLFQKHFNSTHYMNWITAFIFICISINLIFN